MVFQFLCAIIPAANLIVSAVCTYWRYAALGDPWLWRVVDLSWSPDKVDEFMRRSGTVPLTLLIEDRTSLEACRNAATRATIVYMRHRGCPRSRPLDAGSPFNLHWPKVESLVLQTPEPNTSWLPISVEDIFPRLQSLHMSRSYIVMSFTLSTLRTLKITHNIPQPTDMLLLLGKCARLEVLELSAPTKFSLDRSTPMTGEAAYGRGVSGPHICISTLREVTFRLPVGIALLLLSLIDLPSELEHLDVTIYRSYRMRGKLLSTARELFGPQCLPSSTFNDLEELSLHTRHCPWTVRDDCVEFSHVVYHRSSKRYHIELGIKHPYDGDTDNEMKSMFATVVQTIQDHHPMPALRKLRIDGTGQYGYMLQDPSPGIFLRHASSLELLEIRYHRIRDLHRSLVEDGSLELPLLRVLILETVCESEEEVVDHLLPVTTRLSATPIEVLDLGLTCRNIRSPRRAKSLFTRLKNACAPIPKITSAPTAITFTTLSSKSEILRLHPQDLRPKDEPFTWKEADMSDHHL